MLLKNNRLKLSILSIGKMQAFLFIVLSFAAILLSCEAMPVNHSSSQSWLIPENSRKKNISLTLLGVQVDRMGGWDSIEKETIALAPLYFWNRGCKVITAEENPLYAARIQVREREYNVGWRTKRSLAVEVCIWQYKDAPDAGTPVQDRKLPVAVGRVIAIGDKSFSSSEITSRMLSKAIGKASRKLAANERRKRNA